MAPVVWGIEIFAIPARWEEDVGANTTVTFLLGELNGIVVATTRRRHVRGVRKAGALPAPEGKSISFRACGVDPRVTSSEHWVSSDHAETLGGSSDFAIVRWLDVVYRHAAVRATDCVVGHLRYPNKATIGMLEVHDSGPVVGAILLELAACTGGGLGKVETRIHGQIEGIPTDDLMKMRRYLAWCDQGVKPLCHELGTGETNQSLSSRREESSDSKGLPHHTN